MILTNEQISICQIYGVQLVGKNFGCGFDNSNKVPLNALMQACEVRNLTYRIEWATNFELTW